MNDQRHDPIRPGYYHQGDVYEHYKVVCAWGLGYNLGVATKHICRAGKKGDAIEDLEKAIKYIQQEIEILKSAPRPWSMAPAKDEDAGPGTPEDGGHHARMG